jgi:REP element-mobilizing transposase RayT
VGNLDYKQYVIRPGRFNATIKYVLNNPVKAGLVKNWREWRWNYCRSELSDKL